jgi:hypothetical protein
MRWKWRLLGIAGILGVAGYGAIKVLAPTKVAQISLDCRAGDDPTEKVQWSYTAKVDPSVIELIPYAIDITLHYPGTHARPVPPITTYFYREDGAVLRVASSAKASFAPKSDFTYHVDTGGYVPALYARGRGRAEELAVFVAVDGSYFGSLFGGPTCGQFADHHLEVGKASKIPDLSGKHPIDLATSDWLGFTSLPTAVSRIEGDEVSMYAFFPAPIALTETKHEASVPEGPMAQAQEVGVTSATPTYGVVAEPTVGGRPSKPAFDPGAGVQGPGGQDSGGTPATLPQGGKP